MNPPSSKPTQLRQFFNIGSLYQWALLGFILVAIPLVSVIIYAVTEVANYTAQSQKTLFQSVNTTENSRIMLERLIAMERSVRQYQVLKEDDLFKNYLEHRDAFIDVIDSLKSSSFNKDSALQVELLQHNEESLYDSIFTQVNEHNLSLSQDDLALFNKLTSQARALLLEGEKRVAVEANALSVIAERVRNRLVYAALISVPLALILGLIFVHLLTRPIKHIGRAIRSLGEVGLDQAIVINGPKDLTELGINLEWLRQRLNKLEHEKQQFIRNISHELKTPLATLKEGTDLLAENVVGELNTEQQKIIKLMEMGNININGLVENLLEYQRIISTDVELNLSEFSFSALIERVCKEYGLLLRSKHISLHNELSDITLRADYEKLWIIISNLLSNALKFSPEQGSIHLQLRQHNEHIKFTIEDQGPGISEEMATLIFDDFYQGNADHPWKIKGSGLGLPLILHYLEAFQGSINLLPATKDYSGARFCVTLPKTKDHNK